MKLSIVTPVYNGVKFVPTYFEGLKNLKTPKNVDLSIIIVDNDSSDETVVLINSILETDHFKNLNIKCISYPEISSSYAARNFGVKYKESDYYIFTDIDCIFDCDYVNKLYELISISPYDIFGGEVKLFTYKNPNLYEVYDLLFGFNLNAYIKEDTGITANLVVSNNCFKMIRGFDPYISGADRNFCKKAKLEGFSFLYSKNIMVFHPARNSYCEHYIKTIRVAKGKALYAANKNIVFKIMAFIKNLISSIFQFHQIKTLFIKRNIYSNLNFYNKIKLFFLSFFLGMVGRLHINYRMLVKNHYVVNK